MQFVLKKSKLLSRLTMAETEALLPALDFMRIHRSYIVAKKHINKIEKTTVWINETELPAGANYLSEIGKFIKE